MSLEEASAGVSPKKALHGEHERMGSIGEQGAQVHEAQGRMGCMDAFRGTLHSLIGTKCQGV